MKHQRVAPHLAMRSRGALGVALLGLVGGAVAIAGCPGPEPHDRAGSGGANSASAASGSAQGGDTTSGSDRVSASSTGGGMNGPDAGCGNTMSDPNNCGMCGRVCSMMNVAKPVCDRGLCVPICLPGFADLDPAGDNANNGCETAARRVFVTRSAVPLPLNSLMTADDLCKAEAIAAGLGHTFHWRAWLSDSTVAASPLGWETVWAGPYVLADARTPVVMSFSELVAGMNTHLIHPIDMDPTGAKAGVAAVWTGTSASGLSTTHDCGGWMSTTMVQAPTVGGTDQTGPGWTSDDIPTANCASTNVLLYCFEQAT